jgi:hypothetical protein
MELEDTSIVCGQDLAHNADQLYDVSTVLNSRAA